MNAESERIVYGDIHDGLVFVPEPLANDLSVIWDAASVPISYAELRAGVSHDTYRDVIDRLGREPEPGELFDPNTVSNFADGWPTWPAQHQLKWLPRDVIDRFGVLRDSPNGAFLVFPHAAEEPLVEALAECGFQLEEDTGLVRTASGID